MGLTGLTAAKLKRGDVLVAIDGFRVENQAQYLFLRDLKQRDTPLQLIVWDHTGYREVAANPPYRRFGVKLSDFDKR